MIRPFACGLLLTMLLGASVVTTAEDAAALFSHRCSSCHGDDGRAKTAGGRHVGAADLSSPHVQDQSDVSLYDGIGYGVGHKKYPHAFLLRGLSGSEVSQLVKYIRTFGIHREDDSVEATHRHPGNSFRGSAAQSRQR